jgi:hypothetical protein
MKRSILTFAVLAAFLVGCAASAMHFAQPEPAVASKVVHVAKPAVVTGPCYKPNGNNCAATYHIVWGTVSFAVATCAKLTHCVPVTSGTNVVTFTGNAVFNDVPACHTIPGDDNFIAMAAPRATMNSVTIEVFNTAPYSIASETPTFSFQCEGP